MPAKRVQSRLNQSTASCDRRHSNFGREAYNRSRSRIFQEGFMKLLISIFLLAIALPAFPQSAQKPSLPRYNPAAEAVYKGAVSMFAIVNVRSAAVSERTFL